MSHFLKDFSRLASTPLRRDALTILEAGLDGVDTATCLRRVMVREGENVRIGQQKYDLSQYTNVFVIGIGKAAYAAAQFVEEVLGDKITDGVILDVTGGPLKHLTSRIGTHPYPSLQNMKATGEMIGILRHLEPTDLLVMIISGGGSAMLCWPTSLTCGQITKLTEELMRSGATIEEINIVRKHTSDVLGGQVAAMAHPTPIVGLVFSDVPGDNFATIASGPTVMDISTKQDAEKVLDKYNLREACQLPDCEVLETPKDEKMFEHVYNMRVVSNIDAIHAMEEVATSLGYKVRSLGTEVTGEARELGKKMASEIQPGEAIIGGGETTVTIVGNGKGGRNQEVVLGALEDLPEGALILSCASDGIDRAEVAGAFIDDQIKENIIKKKLSSEEYLKNNDSLNFFKKAGGHIVTGPTNRNVSDLFLIIRPH